MIRLIEFHVSSISPVLNVHITGNNRTIDKLVSLNGKDYLELGLGYLKELTGSDFAIVAIRPVFGSGQWGIKISVDGKVGTCYKTAKPNTEIRKIIMEAAIDVYNFWYPS